MYFFLKRSRQHIAVVDMYIDLRKANLCIVTQSHIAAVRCVQCHVHLNQFGPTHLRLLDCECAMISQYYRERNPLSSTRKCVRPTCVQISHAIIFYRQLHSPLHLSTIFWLPSQVPEGCMVMCNPQSVLWPDIWYLRAHNTQSATFIKQINKT